MPDLRLVGRIAFRISLGLALLGVPKIVMAGVTLDGSSDLTQQAIDLASNLLSTVQTSGCSLDDLGIALGGAQNQIGAGTPQTNTYTYTEQFSGWDDPEHTGGHAEQHGVSE